MSLRAPTAETWADAGSRAWETSAACRGQDADLWFTQRYTSTALAICAACPVLDPCRTAVLHRERSLPRCDRQGIIAGLTGAQRHALAQTADGPPRRNTEPPPAPPDDDVPPTPTPDRSTGPSRRPPTGSRRPHPAARPLRAAAPPPRTAAAPPPRTATGPPSVRVDDPVPPETPPSGDGPYGRDARDPRPRLAPCGTRAAYQRHLRRGEFVDEACRDANARGAGRYRRTGSTRDRTDETRPRAATVAAADGPC
ncbi:WhiB family transcriptional regulator [Streptomyces sp. NPDC057280]|uniref:WhiB family transcriptional regulator n=1 Tax=Streptomyces sp. NPDC057280 TaxID=3346081 RepID=UPI0036419BC9